MTLDPFHESRLSEVIEAIINLLKDEQGNSMPRVVLERELSHRFSERLYKEGIQRAVNEFRVNLVTDYPADKWEVDSGEPAWHVKLLSPDDAKKLRKLKPVQLALLRLLQQQDWPYGLGEMRVQDAREKLVALGFSEREAGYPHIDDVTEYFYNSADDLRIEHVALISEHEKDPAIKAARAETERELEEHMEEKMYMEELFEKEEERRRKRAEARKKRAKQLSQSRGTASHEASSE